LRRRRWYSAGKLERLISSVTGRILCLGMSAVLAHRVVVSPYVCHSRLAPRLILHERPRESKPAVQAFWIDGRQPGSDREDTVGEFDGGTGWAGMPECGLQSA